MATLHLITTKGEDIIFTHALSVKRADDKSNRHSFDSICYPGLLEIVNTDGSKLQFYSPGLLRFYLSSE